MKRMQKFIVSPTLFTVILLASLLLLAIYPAEAQEKFPTKTITIINPFEPGGGHDNMAQPFTKILPPKLGVPVIIQHNPGAGGRLGWDRLWRSDPDGYTLATYNNSGPIGQALFPDQVKYDIRKLTYLININAEPTFVAVSSKSQFKDIKQFVQYAKDHPGELKMGTAGVGARAHISGIKVTELLGIKTQFIPYKGAAGYKTAILAGEVDFTVTDASDVGGNPNYRLLVINSLKRSALLPEIPTWKESGFGDIYDIVWRGFALPPGVPQERVKILEEAFRWGIKQPEWLKHCQTMRFENDYWGPEEFKKMALEEYETVMKYKPFLK